MAIAGPAAQSINSGPDRSAITYKGRVHSLRFAAIFEILLAREKQERGHGVTNRSPSPHADAVLLHKIVKEHLNA